MSNPPQQIDLETLINIECHLNSIAGSSKRIAESLALKEPTPQITNQDLMVILNRHYRMYGSEEPEMMSEKDLICTEVLDKLKTDVIHHLKKEPNIEQNPKT